MSKKRRVFQVAREFGISIEELTRFLEKLNYGVSSQMSMVTDEMYQSISNEFGEKTKVITDDYDIKRELKQKKESQADKKEKELAEYKRRLEISTQVMADTIERRKQGKKLKKTAGEISITDREKGKKKLTDKEKEKQEEFIKQTIEREKKKETPDKKKIEAEKLEAEEQVAAKEDEKVKQDKVATEEKVIVGKKPEAEKPDKAAKDKAEKEKAETKQKLKRKKLKRKERLADKDKKEEEETPQKARVKKKRAEREKEEAKPKRKLKKRKKKKFVISEEEVEESIKQTFAAMEEASRPKRRRKKAKEAEDVTAEDEQILRVNEFITIGELAQEIEVETSELIKKCMELGMLVTINQRLDQETIEIVADEYGYKVEIIPEYGSDILEDIEEKEEDLSKLQERSPVVTIMGHVDHGKTSLLDYVRKSNIIKQEAGGITQHIGAYQVKVDSKMITFLDTPGHEAFTAMRARGAQATDIVVLIIAADDKVMPQTIEAIDHAKAAEVPIVVAINKIDKPNANPDMIKKQLSEHGVLIEEWGGKHQSVNISAKTGDNVEKLLESILIEAEMLELKANPDRFAKGVVIESRLDKGKGAMATVLVQKGTLKVGDPFIVGQYAGRVRGMFDEFGKKKKEAGPSVPVQVIGFSGLPQAGDTFMVLKSEKDTREISLKRQQIKREQEHQQFRHLTLDEISQQIKKGAVKELSIIIKGDVDGSVEAINDSLLKLSTDEVTVKVILRGVGAISESDVLLASASRAIIIGFQVRPTIKAREIAKNENVDIRIYRVIYDAISDVRDALEGLLEPTLEEENIGTLEVRDIFKVPKIGTVAGCYVLTGKISRNDLVRLYREDKLIYEGKIDSLKRFKDDAKEVASGYECGVGLENFDDVKIGDVIETYKVIEIKRKLAVS